MLCLSKSYRVVSMFMLPIFAWFDWNLEHFFHYTKDRRKKIWEDFTSSFSTQACCVVPLALSIKCQMHKVILTPCVAMWGSSIIQTHMKHKSHSMELCQIFSGLMAESISSHSKKRETANKPTIAHFRSWTMYYVESPCSCCDGVFFGASFWSWELCCFCEKLRVGSLKSNW